MRGIYSICVFGIFCISLPIQAQLSVSVSAGIGGVVLQPVTDVAEQSLVSYTVAKDVGQIFETAYGTGITSRIRVNYAISRFLGIDLDASLFSGFSRFNTQNVANNQLTENVVKSPRLGLNPGVTVSTGWKIFAPYLRMGFLIPGRQKIRATKVQQVNEDVWTRDISLVSRTSFGWNGGIGMSYKVSRRIKMFYEFEYLSQKTAVRKASLTRFTYNEVDVLPDLKTFQKEIVYKNNLSPDANRPLRPGFDQDEPTESKAFKRSTSSITANFGIILNLI